ncbi:hypothetical protein [Streptomyces sp. NPDC001492]
MRDAHRDGKIAYTAELAREISAERIAALEDGYAPGSVRPCRSRCR